MAPSLKRAKIGILINMKKSQAIELIAVTLYENYDGLTDEAYAIDRGYQRRPFDEQTQSVQDEFYFMAHQVMAVMELIGMKPPKKDGMNFNSESVKMLLELNIKNLEIYAWDPESGEQ